MDDKRVKEGKRGEERKIDRREKLRVDKIRAIDGQKKRV